MQSPSRPAASRGPPMIPPGMPVKSGHLDTFKSQLSSRSLLASDSPGDLGGKNRPHLPTRQPSSASTHSLTNQISPGSKQQPPQQQLLQSHPPIPENESPDSSYDSSVESDSIGSSTLNVHASMRSLGSGTSRSAEGARSPVEPDLVTPKEQYIPHVGIHDDVESQFEHLLDSLQVPSSVRIKFSAVSQDVKNSILSSTLSSNPAILASLGLSAPLSVAPQKTPKAKRRLSAGLRRTKSSSNLESPGQDPQIGKTYAVDGDAFVIVASPSSTRKPPPPSRKGSSESTRPPHHSRRNTAPRPLSLAIFGPSASSNSVPSVGKNGGKGLGIAMGEGSENFISWLQAYKATDLNMDVARCKKLRMLLRHESTTWVGSFIDQGGYDLILARLQDLLDVEWREEQHDDQMLYEILRCIKALSTSDVGKAAIRRSYPKPFPALSALIFSEKKPGDIATRQIIIELWLFLYDLYPNCRNVNGRPSPTRFDNPSGPSVDVSAAIRGLLLPDSADKTKDHHSFITQAHRPRIFKAWVQELSDICRDYFWIMCHGNNTLWALEEVDESLVEKPVAPGGATGGVEFEAVNYVIVHFRLLNRFCSQMAREDPEKATHLHGELLMSGLDRILVTMRKASTTYYPTLHLELSRYVAHLRAASPTGRLPHLIDKLVGPPPEELRRRRSIADWHAQVSQATASSSQQQSRQVPLQSNRGAYVHAR
ncbi:armadillo-type protein [Kockovaella imperatae]|uniref:Armadillo-type protein n=1 Tax=Kockovaella imperatae TaxID=4999 RepID=A0A1Y1UFX4_9TREE|nr:armadillo-type protein [Kockovaella imperatae]ORX36928.1 armadillo-type protein [Kockovaella imperatae]